MKRKSIVVPGLHHGGQPIPIASIVGDILISGGVFGMDPETGDIPKDSFHQCKLMFENVSRIMDEAQGTLDNIVRFTIFLSDNSYRDFLNDEWVMMFPNEFSRPSRMTVSRDLPNPAIIQCEFVAVL